MKTCEKCGKQAEDSAEVCECGNWFRVAPSSAQPVSLPRPVATKSASDRALNLWGGICGFLLGMGVVGGGTWLVSLVLAIAGYAGSVLLLSLYRRANAVLSVKFKMLLAGLYLLAAFTIAIFSEVLVGAGAA